MTRPSPPQILPAAGVIAASAGLALWFAAGWGGGGAIALADDVVLPAAPLAAGFTALWHRARPARGYERWAWGLIGASCLSWGLGEVLWAVYGIALGNELPFPSLADAGYLGAVPPAIAGLVFFRSFPNGALGELRALAGAVMTAIGIFAISWMTALGAIFDHTHLSSTTEALSLVYPISDIVIAAVAVYAASGARPLRRRALSVIAAGLVVNAIADTCFAYLNAVGSYRTGHPMDALWFLGFGLLLVGALQPMPSTAERSRPALPQQPARVSASDLVALAAIGLVVAGALRGDPEPPALAAALALALLLAATHLVADLADGDFERRRRRAMEDLRENETRLWEVSRTAPFGIIATDQRGLVTLAVGRAVSELLPEDSAVVGAPLRSLTGDAGVGKAVEAALRGTASTVSVATGRSQLEVTVGPVTSALGAVAGTTAVIVDVGEYRRAQQAIRDADAKMRFMASISHEFRTPLTAILGFAQLLQRPEFDSLTERQRRHVDNIAGSGRHLLELVNDLLDLSKIAAGKMDLRIDRFDLVPMVQEVVASVAPLAIAKNLDLEVAGCGRPASCAADSRRLRQVLLNLLSNAIKFTDVGGAVTVTVERGEDLQRISVRDTGVGIPPDHLESIFEAFVQLDNPQQRLREGTGLGLPLSRQLLNAMGGEITVTSRPGQGSCFVFTVPAVTESASRRADEEPALAMAQPSPA